MNEEKDIPKREPGEENPELTKEGSPHFPEDGHAPKSATEKMETHAHHLHKAPGNKFWHYFFEFFVLFLAVFCGFLAEK